MAVEFARGIYRHLCGGLKKTEQIKHNKLSAQLKSQV